MTKEEKLDIWNDRIKSYNARQGSAQDWCAENNIRLSTLRYWITKLNNETKAASTSTEWLPVEFTNSPMKPDEASFSGISINIGLASIRISSEFNPQTLSAVVKVLSQNVK